MAIKNYEKTGKMVAQLFSDKFSTITDKKFP